jgi:predicted alpha/beta-hydrolase family hydrolase
VPVGTGATREWRIPTPAGEAGVALDLPAGTPVALLVLGHGAGGGVGAPDLVAVTEAAVEAGVAVARVTQPYRLAGRRVPPRPPVLDAAWTAVVARLRALPAPAAGTAPPAPAVRRGSRPVDVVGRVLGELPLVVGGRSSGARVACRTATELGASAVVALAFPTRPPRTPDRHRLDELALPAVPVLVVQGERDRFGVPPAAPGRTVHLLPGATHDLRGPAARAAAAVAVPWLLARASAGPPTVPR